MPGREGIQDREHPVPGKRLEDPGRTEEGRERRAQRRRDDAGREPLAPFSPNPRLNAPELYQPSPALADAVNVALRLGMPLLLTGDPGTGKTQLAHHLAWYYHTGKTITFSITVTDIRDASPDEAANGVPPMEMPVLH